MRQRPATMSTATVSVIRRQITIPIPIKNNTSPRSLPTFPRSRLFGLLYFMQRAGI